MDGSTRSAATSQRRDSATSAREDASERRRPRDHAAIARLDAMFAAAPPEWQEFFDELDRRDPKMR